MREDKPVLPKKPKLMNAFRKAVLVGLAITATKITMIADDATTDQYGPNKTPIVSDLIRMEKNVKCGDDCQDFSRFIKSEAASVKPSATYKALQQMQNLPVGQKLVQQAGDSHVTMRANDPVFKERADLHGQFVGKTGTYSYKNDSDASMRVSLSVAWHEMHHMHQYGHGLNVTSFQADKNYTPKEQFLTLMVMEMASFTFDKVMMHRYHLAGAPGMNENEKADLKNYVQEFSDLYQQKMTEGLKPVEAEKITAQAMFRFHAQSDAFQQTRGTYVKRQAPQQHEMMQPATDALKIADLQKLAEIPGAYSFLPPEFTVAAFEKQMLQDLNQNWTHFTAQENKASVPEKAQSATKIAAPQQARICYTGSSDQIKKINNTVQAKIKQGL